MNSPNDLVFVSQLSNRMVSSTPNTLSTHARSFVDCVRAYYRNNNRLQTYTIGSHDTIDYKDIEENYIPSLITETQDERKRQIAFREANTSSSSRDEQVRSYENLFRSHEAVEVKDVFENQTTKKVLMCGRAGVGKSTMCRFIAVKWARRELWTNEFSLVVHIPLGEFVDEQDQVSARHFLATIVHSRYLTEAEQSQFSIETIINYLDSHHRSILYVLDGYDEVSYIVNDKTKRRSALAVLLRQVFHNRDIRVMLTSRPIQILEIVDVTVKFDRSLENIGFSDYAISDYISQYVLDSDALLSFLQSRKDVWGIAHIPLQLDLLCQLWQEDRQQVRKVTTISELYFQMEICLRKRYLTRCKGRDGESLSFAEIDQETGQLSMTLERLAFQCVQQHRVILVRRDIEREPLLSELFASSLLFKHGNGDAHFSHLTFQEFYAAGFIAKQFMKGLPPQVSDIEQKMAIDMMHENKYDQYHEMVWLLTIGYLHLKEHIDGVRVFFRLLDDSPRDAIGTHHVCVTILCLNECNLGLLERRRARPPSLQ